MRDDFSAATKRVIAKRVGWRCSNPQCRALTEGPSSDPTRAVSVGVAAHITAASPHGPRFDPLLTEEERTSPGNGIWLCQTCARKIDGDESRYWLGVLLFWKGDSENLVEQELGVPENPSPELQPLRYSAIGVAPECLWWNAPRLHKVALPGGLHPDFGFHEIPPLYWDGEGKSPQQNPVEPILDVTIVNDGARVGTVTAVGLELIDTWTAIKGLQVAERVSVSDVYVLTLKEMVRNEPQFFSLKDPMAIPGGGGIFRFQMWLENFGRAVHNESLVRVVAEFEGKLRHSGIVYLGRY